MKKVLLAITFSLLILLGACAEKVPSGFAEEDGVTRYYKEGTPLEGWFDINGARYHFDKGGAMSVGLVKLEGETFYFDAAGKMLSGTQTIAGAQYRFAEDGRALNGFVAQNDGSHHYTDGRMSTGWIEIEGAKYYFDENGKAASGITEIDGATYCLDNEGKALSGVISINGATMFFGEDGKKALGFQSLEGNSFYFTDSGMAEGFQEIEGKTYFFDTTGKMLTGWQTIGEKRYHFGEDGIMSVDIVIDGYRIGPDGVAGKEETPPQSAATGQKTGTEDLDNAVKEILDTITGADMDKLEQMKAAYNWMVNKMRYKYITVDLADGYTEGLINELAAYSVDRRNGSCEHYAALLYVYFRRLGVEAMVVEGTRWDHTNNTWGEHAWVIATVNGKTYHFDPLFGRNHTSDAMSMFMAKDKDLEATHTWDRDYYPACQ